MATAQQHGSRRNPNSTTKFGSNREENNKFDRTHESSAKVTGIGNGPPGDDQLSCFDTVSSRAVTTTSFAFKNSDTTPCLETDKFFTTGCPSPSYSVLSVINAYAESTSSSHLEHQQEQPHNSAAGSYHRYNQSYDTTHTASTDYFSIEFGSPVSSPELFDDTEPPLTLGYFQKKNFQLAGGGAKQGTTFDTFADTWKNFTPEHSLLSNSDTYSSHNSISDNSEQRQEQRGLFENRPDVMTNSVSSGTKKKPGFFRRLFGAKESNSNEQPAAETKNLNTDKKDDEATDEFQTPEEEMKSPIAIPARSDSLNKHKPTKIIVPRKPVPRLKLEPNSPFLPDYKKEPVGLGLLDVEDASRNQATIYEEGVESGDPGPPLPSMKKSSEPAYTAPYSTRSSPLSQSSTFMKSPLPSSPVVSTFIKHHSAKPSVSSNSTAHMTVNEEKLTQSTTNNTQNSLDSTPNHSTNTSAEMLDGNSPSTSLNISEGDDERTAKKLYEGSSRNLSPDEYAQWMGSDGEEQKAVRIAFMNLFDWTGNSILYSLRMLCDKLYMKGESQQLNRVIEAFSQSWVEKNPRHGFYDANVVYTIAYALILLNTDVHGADHTVQKKMAKSAFVHNTMETIRSQSRAEKQANQAAELLSDEQRDAQQVQRSQTPLSNKRSSLSMPGSTQSVAPYDATTLVGESPVKPLTKEWEFHLESILKVFYTSIAKEALKLHLVENTSPGLSAHIYGSSSSHALSPTLSAAPSTRSFGQTSAVTNSSLFGRMSNKWKGRNTFENQSRLSSTTDRSMENMRRNSLNSTFSFESNYSAIGRHAVGFAGLLWNSMIKEEEQSSSGLPNNGDYNFADFSQIEEQLAKETELELHGAPWAKEGLLSYRPYIDPSTGKKPKKKDWNKVFVVVQRGQLKIFKFDLNKKPKANNDLPINGVVGGGNWMDNAELVDGFHLCHTMAQELPPPKKAREYTASWSLTLPQRGLLVFQSGTAEIAQEFVYTCNYWAGRLSKEPFEEPVSSMEFGWGSPLDNSAASYSSPNLTVPPQSLSRPPSMSALRSNGRSPNLRPGDKVVIKEWRPTSHSMVVSDLDEDRQLANLKAYVANAENKLVQHNALRARLMQAFTQGSPNYNKAHQNWERKSQYLLQQLIRYKTYVENLERGERDKERFENGGEEMPPPSRKDSSAATSELSPVDTIDSYGTARGSIHVATSIRDFPQSPTEQC